MRPKNKKRGLMSGKMSDKEKRELYFGDDRPAEEVGKFCTLPPEALPRDKMATEGISATIVATTDPKTGKIVCRVIIKVDEIWAPIKAEAARQIAGNLKRYADVIEKIESGELPPTVIDRELIRGGH